MNIVSFVCCFCWVAAAELEGVGGFLAFCTLWVVFTVLSIF